MCDLSDILSVRRAAAEIAGLHLPIVGLQMRATKNGLGWDVTFATNHLGPFALTEARSCRISQTVRTSSSSPPA